MPRTQPRSHRPLPTRHRFNLLNKEFTFTIDTSNLPCGLNGALYFVEMQKDGGVSEYTTHEASRWGAMSRPLAPV